MGWRYRKSISLVPGVRMNFGMHSTSVSVGGSGFHTTFSSTGRVTRSVGIPGTGLSYVTSSTTNHGSRTSQSQPNPQLHYAQQPRTLPQTPPAPAIDVDAVRTRIENIYAVADENINWKAILISDTPPANEQQQYYKSHAEKVLNGDIDTYFELINDLNPLDDLLQDGSEFECGTEDPRMLSVHFDVNSRSVLPDANKMQQGEYNDLLQDYVCACTIRIARDMFALLPLRHIVVDASDNNIDILSVDFTRREFEKLDFSNIDASDTIATFNHQMSFSQNMGFGAIVPIDS